MAIPISNITAPQQPDIMSMLQQPQPAQNVPVAPIDQIKAYGQTPEGQHLNDVFNQYLSNKQDQQQSVGSIGDILAQRFQPTEGDVGNSIAQTAQSFLTPELFKPVTPQQYAANRAQMELMPYTTGLDMQAKQGQIDQQNIMNQFLPQEEQAKLNLLKAQALMDSGGGLFGGGTGGPTGQPINTLTGQDFLKTLSPAAAGMVQAITEGRQPLPSGFVLKTPFGQQLLTAVHAYDPSFDFVNANARMNTRKSFTSGPDANNIAALNTAMAHLGTLSDSFKNLDNSSFPMWNSFANAAGNQLGVPSIQANTAAVGTDAEAVSHELAKVFRSTGMSEGEINAWKEKINTSASPTQMNATINSALDLMEGRMQALAEKYNQGMGTTKQGLELLSPQAQKAYNKLRGFNDNSIQAKTNDNLKSMSDQDLLKALGQ